MNEIFCKDYVDFLNSIDDDSVDLVITDPPYGISDPKKVRISSKNNEKYSISSGNFGEEDKDVGLDWFSSVYRILRPGGNFILFSGYDQQIKIKEKAKEVGLQPKQPWYWCKSNSSPTPRKNMVSSVENGWLIKKPNGENIWNGGYTTKNYFIGPFYSATYKSGKRIHPMQKPAWLIKEMVMLWSKEEDIIIDPFCGSGEVAVQAILNNRQYMCCDISEKYVNATIKRLEELKNDNI